MNHIHQYRPSRLRPSEVPKHPYYKAGDKVLVCIEPECRQLYFANAWIDRDRPRRDGE